VAAEWRWHNEWQQSGEDGIMSGSMNVFIAIHYTGDEVKGVRWVGHVARRGERRNTYRVLVGKITGKRQL
jgi:hypothetical protein